MAIGTAPVLGVGQSAEVLVDGPGYVGPAVLMGTSLQLQGYADDYCAVEESNENDDSLEVTLTIGR